MNTFDDIRPYNDGEVEDVIRRLLLERDFLKFIGQWQAPRLQKMLPGLVEWMVRRTLAKHLNSVSSIEGFQAVVEHYVSLLIAESITEFKYLGFEKLERDESYLFISNHRDIAGDSMLLNYALFHKGMNTVRIAVGDNLIQRQFATDIMKLNKSFFIRRGESGRKKVYAALLESSQYIEMSMNSRQSVWIAQSEGRAKDGIDLTDPALIKMLTLCNRKADFAETIGKMRIVPVTLSYEFDPCDAIKARELTALAESGKYSKAEGEDLLSLVKGLAGFKGRVTLRLGDILGPDYASAEQVASELDRQILGNLELYPINYWALSQIQEEEYSSVWDKIKQDIELVDTRLLDEKLQECEAGHRDYWLRMYANPVLNKLKATA
ncbi:MAG: 1-acyl-sn-glycerol-3-phosphate acyltransferase [Pseudomonadales bacterium]|jgi:hypothetical protein